MKNKSNTTNNNCIDVLETPKVTVIMPVYNEEESIKETVESILNQEYRNFEFIIVDSSIDNTPSIINSFSDPRIKYIRSDRDEVTYKLNIGLKKAKGKCIARMDARCYAHPEKIKKQVEFLDANPLVGVVGTWDKISSSSNIKIRTHPVSNIEIKKKLLYENPFSHPTIMVRKEIFEKLGGYRPSLPRVQDYAFYVDACNLTRFHNIPEILLEKRIDKEKITFEKTKSLKIIKARIYVRLLAFRKAPKDVESTLRGIKSLTKLLAEAVLSLVYENKNWMRKTNKG